MTKKGLPYGTAGEARVKSGDSHSMGKRVDFSTAPETLAQAIENVPLSGIKTA
jgi:hypothetical protein